MGAIKLLVSLPLEDAGFSLGDLWYKYRWIAVLALFVAACLLHLRRSSNLETLTEGGRLQRQLFTLFLVLAGIIAVILSLPDHTVRSELFGLFGLLASAMIALASSTLLGNILAGVMLRSIDNLKPGDFVRVEEKFGRVTLRGLFAVEIQTEARNLVTIPNMALVSKSVEVIRGSGTILSGEVSLGYDAPRQDVEHYLLEAAEAAGLEGAYVQILSLGDFSVVYRVCGLQKDVSKMITVRSDLHEQMIDHLHGAGIEIMSPNFVNQRRTDASIPVIAKGPRGKKRESEVGAEDVAFDKADMAGDLQMLRDRHAEMVAEAETLSKLVDKADDEQERTSLEHAFKRLQNRIDALARGIESRGKSFTKLDEPKS